VREELLPDQLVGLALERSIGLLAFTYTEPLVTYEYVRDASGLARGQGLRTVLVTAGFVQPRPLRDLCSSVDAVTLDVKAFDERLFRDLAGGRVAPCCAPSRSCARRGSGWS
jgi:pyruvate formate lyase activating enzyme